MSRRRKQSRRSKTQIKDWTIALRQYILPALLVIGVGLYSAKDSFYFDNGAGGADWKIGKPKVTWLNAQSQRPLPETRQFARSLVRGSHAWKCNNGDDG